MEDFARFVGGKLGLVAVDQTGLKGLYDFKVEWKVDLDQSTNGLPGQSRDALRFAVLQALQEQVGLKLIGMKITVHMLVIDGAERATASEN